MEKVTFSKELVEAVYDYMVNKPYKETHALLKRMEKEFKDSLERSNNTPPVQEQVSNENA